MADSHDRDALPPGIPPEVAEQIRRARENQRTAAVLQQAIATAGFAIEGLRVTYSSGVAVLSGRARSHLDREGAAEVARRGDGVREVSNGIVVVKPQG